MNPIPPSLPMPSQEFGHNSEFDTARTQGDGAEALQRERGTVVLDIFPVMWSLDDVQFGLFQSFYLYGTNSGVSWFTIDLPIEGEIKHCQARFTKGYNYKHQPGSNWEVNAELEAKEI